MSICGTLRFRTMGRTRKKVDNKGEELGCSECWVCYLERIAEALESMEAKLGLISGYMRVQVM